MHCAPTGSEINLRDSDSCWPSTDLPPVIVLPAMEPSMPPDYPTLFSPITLGPRTAKNRIWMTAHATEFSTDGTFADASADYYAERARGGVAVITMEAMAVHPTTQP